jgi:hypothetical protein
MKKTTRLVLIIVFVIVFQIFAILNWDGGCRAWPTYDGFPPEANEMLYRVIILFLWIDTAIVLGVLVKRWYYIMPLFLTPILESLLAPAGFRFLQEYEFSEIWSCDYYMYHVVCSLSGLVVCSFLIVMLVIRLCILDPLEKSGVSDCQGCQDG